MITSIPLIPYTSSKFHKNIRENNLREHPVFSALVSPTKKNRMKLEPKNWVLSQAIFYRLYRVNSVV